MSLDSNNSGWVDCTLGDIVTFKRGYDLPKDKMNGGKYPVVGSNGIIGFHDEFTTESPGITIGRSGNVGKPFIVKEPSWSHNTTLFVEKFKNVDPYFVYYYLKTIDLKQFAGGSAVPTLNRNHIHPIDIRIPADIIEQKKISRLLLTLDEKIEVLGKINKNLEEQLKLIFNEWFESKINCKLPNNWEVVKLQEVASFSQGVQVPIDEQKEKPEKGYIRFIRIIDITQRNEKDIRFIEDRDRGHVTENEIFMIRYGTPGILSRNYNGIIANNLFKISPLKRVTSNYLFSALNVDRIQNFIKGNATSSTMPAISFSTLHNQEIIIPDNEIMKKFDVLSENVRLLQLSILNETKKLSQLRNVLLPKLLSGEIDVSKINCDLDKSVVG